MEQILMEQITAKIYDSENREYKGTAWLCSCEYALTAAHCVGDRKKKEFLKGPFRLEFMNGEVVEAEIDPENYDFDLDVALLQITGGKVPEKIQIFCGRVTTYSPWVAKNEEWFAYGYPVGNETGMEISGTITSLRGNVEGKDAYQLLCDQGGFGELQGTSGAAVRYKNMIVGVVRWAPTSYQQKVIYASPLYLIAEKLPILDSIIQENFKEALEKIAPNLLTPSSIRSVPDKPTAGKGFIGKNTPNETGEGQHNLPQPKTKFIQRPEFSEVVNLVLEKDSRLVTIEGSMGAGKTRLAIEVGKELVRRNSFGDGVFFVNLATVSDPGNVAREIANTLGIKEAQNFSFAESLKLYLCNKQMLLIIDNFEHTSANWLITNLLNDSVNLKILVTSNKPLNLKEEKVVLIDSLSFPDSSSSSKWGAAAELFVERSQEINKDFEPTEQSMEVIAEICRKLNGLPLAIEIVAAQANSDRKLQEAVEDLSATLDDSSDPLQEAVKWSYDNLTPTEQRILRRLTVFVGSFTSSAAEFVCRDFGDSPGTVAETLNSLTRSFLLQERQSNAEVRYRMSKKIKQYCSKQVDAAGETVAAQRSHAIFFLERAKKAEARMTVLTSEERKEWLNLLEMNLDDIREILKWGLQSKNDEVLGLQLAASLFWFWNLRGYLTEGFEYLNLALEADLKVISSQDMARALYAAGGLAFMRGDYEEARGLLEKSVLLWRGYGNKRRLGYSLIILGMVALNQGKPDEGRLYEEESVSIFREVDDRWGLALSLNDLGNVFNENGDRKQALSCYQEGLALWKELDDKWGYSLTLSNMGQLALWDGDYISARELQLEALTIRRDEGNQWGFAESLRRLGSVFVAQAESAQSSKSSDDKVSLLNYIEAAKLHYDSLVLHHQLGRRQLIAECLEDLAWIAVKLEQLTRAATLYGAAESARDNTRLSPSKQKDYDSRIEIAKKYAENYLAEFNNAWLQGTKMTIEQAVSLATESVKEWTSLKPTDHSK